MWRARFRTWMGMLAAIPGIATVAGCLSQFSERSFPMDASRTVRLASAQEGAPARPTARQWLTHAHREFAPLLPSARRSPLITQEMVCADGTPVDASAHFDIQPDKMQTLAKNYRGMKYSGQAGARGYFIETETEPWPGFEQIWIPIKTTFNTELSLSGRLGFARNPDGTIKDADCIVVLPGMFGDHGVKRSEDMCIALRDAGFHVLHVEPRGHGQTERRYPNIYFTYGVAEADDLIQVSDWLETQPHVRRTGLIGYCWNANIAIYSAWLDGKSADDPIVSPALAPLLPSYDPARRRYRAGVIALSPVVSWEALMDQLDYQRSFWKHPIFAAIQTTVRDRQKRKGFEAKGNLRQAVEDEYQRYGDVGIHFPGGSRDAYSFLRLIEYKGQPTGDKLEAVRVPLLIIAGADDPLIPCQDIVDLLATASNPNVAGLILPTGGHVGFSAYCPEYYLNLVTNFFDPQTGPAALQETRKSIASEPRRAQGVAIEAPAR